MGNMAEDDQRSTHSGDIDVEKGLQRSNSNSNSNTRNGGTNSSLKSNRSNGIGVSKAAPRESGEPDTNRSVSNDTTNEKSRSQSTRVAVVCRVVMVSVSLAFLIAVVAFLWYHMGWLYGLPALVVAVVTVTVARVGWRWFYIAAVTISRDTKGLNAYLKLLLKVRSCSRKNVTIGDIFQTHVAEHPDKECIIYEDKVWSFRDINEFSNRVANLFHSHGYKKGDAVCLFLENRPEFVATWLGLSKIGVITPLINTNLRGSSLLHSINIADSSALIYGEAFADVIEEISKELPSTLALYQFNNDINKPVRGLSKDLSTLLQSAAKDKIPASAERADHHDKLLYIYTSGTTGLPKAAVISHARFLFIVAGLHYTMGLKTTDVFYTPLPLYHTAGGVMFVGQAIIFGATVVIKKKFSASGYFADCKKYNATVGQYIGEMCRYILSTKPSSVDKAHKLRLIIGNGLRPQIWPQFVERFNIPRVGEFYGATEGNANIINNDNTVGAIGFISRIIPQIYPISIIRADEATGEPIRNADGLCELCEPGEPGLFIGKIIKGNPSREFLGYVDKKASEKKIVRDVFIKGDMAFLSGDLLEADERGYLYFKDRTGDTFRWKGENVSTSEVEAQVSNIASYCDSIVYGVQLPNVEGRAGMAAIYDPEEVVNLDDFAENVKNALPNYARPLFLRFLTKIDLTGTFKLRKVDLQKDGFNPNVISDKIYYLTSKGKYERLTPDIYEQINQGEVRF